MKSDTRRALNLEHHWSMETRPSVPFNLDEDGPDEKYFEELLLKYPIPHDYNPGGDTDPSLGYIDLDKKPAAQSSAPPKIDTSSSRNKSSFATPRGKETARKGRMGSSSSSSTKKFRD